MANIEKVSESTTGDGDRRVTTTYTDGSTRVATQTSDGKVVTDIDANGVETTGPGATGVFGTLAGASRTR